MCFRTKITIPTFNFNINHDDKFMMMGSCFAENMAMALLESGFQVDMNPFGTVYNPQSLASGIRNLLSRKKYATSDLFFHQGLYHSFSHHSRFSDISAENCIENINRRLETSADFLKSASILVVTYGTSYVYSLKSTGETVTNCHKLPDNHFTRKRLSVTDIVTDWDLLIKELKFYNPDLKLLFTVSPIRHWKDGAHENQLSKATLLLAIDELIRQNDFCHYFPSYEIVMDELRDYRFYAEDMLHPSSVAVEYIGKRFSDTFFTFETQSKVKEWQNIQKALKHKPFNPDSDEHKEFLRKTQERLENFGKKS